MSLSQDASQVRPKAEWTPSRDAYLVQLFVEQYNSGKTSLNGLKPEVFKDVARDFNEKFALNFEDRQIKNRYNVLKKDYGIVKTLLSTSGFSWDETRQVVVAQDDVWERYTVVHNEAKAFRRKGFPLYNQLSIIFGGARANGKCQISSGAQATPEEGNSNTETFQASEPTAQPAQEANANLEKSSSSFDSIFNVEETQPKKRGSDVPTSSHRSKRVRRKAEDKIADALHEIAMASKLRATRKAELNEKTLYQKCIEELQEILELDDSEFAKAVNVLKEDKNAIAFITIKGPRRLTWLRSLWSAQ
ncbi:PREDICTED: uncharacterized protein At2g29880-like [Nelumbo nucifera]|uniref:Myb/SANT-like domain-containing protein n=2 Tax=Nelumbo nucifera TaxID=4432 RepID=A0A822ZBN1_NELNU|nr:PREDICTED: uncharacterized protein At2g29880-like [Nelumbo nucifera]DAD40446.1 TPA_asm: hypothetical protein HUJ06_014769 [Nelumbo nucifera]